MSALKGLEPKRVFEFFEEISAIPRGSGNMNKIADYCENFAIKNSLRYIRDNSNNVIIFKEASKGYENAEPVILQGHIDMVCQKDKDYDIDFEKDGLTLYAEGDFLKAKGTTLGADNGIAVAMVLSVLESNDISHPQIEAVFTTDEEIGMIGARALDTAVLKSRKMINLDSEEIDTVTVSCAGGSEFNAFLKGDLKTSNGELLTLTIKGLKGGHSGVCINEGRQNAHIILGRILGFMKSLYDFKLVSVSGGDKSNAIPNFSAITLLCENANEFKEKAEEYASIIKEEIFSREPDFEIEIKTGGTKNEEVFSDDILDKLIFALFCTPNSVLEMSAEIENLVETSLNLGVLNSENNKITLGYALRSNKKSALKALEDKLYRFYSVIDAEIETGGHYPPWEFNPDSSLQKIYEKCYFEQFGAKPKVEAIHAGLECGVFADKIENFDCIAIGPELLDVHTVNERLSISSTAEIYKLLLEILKNCK
ncbi:MAG: aminoacyl-histidine dipeptidase [Clostridia bacterium]|nr:aminoacyl-histidine dipeptidase [Clostridia bacterium]